MEAYPYIIMAFIGITIILTWIDFFAWLFSGERCFPGLKHPIQAIVMFFPVLGLFAELEAAASTGGLLAGLLPGFRLLIIVLAFLCLVAFFLSTIRHNRGSVLQEVVLNGLLLIGVGLDLGVGLMLRDGYVWAFFVLPIANQFLLVLGENSRLTKRRTGWYHVDDLPAG